MDSSFRSTVLQRPQDDEEDRRRHDAVGPRHTNFALRSPTQPPSEFNHRPYPHQYAPPPPPSAPSAPGHPPASRASALHHPYGSDDRLPPHHPAAPPSSSALSAPAATSPLHAPPMYYPQAAPPPPPPPQQHLGRQDEPPPGKFYDPTTDTTRERRSSDASSRWMPMSRPSAPAQQAPSHFNYPDTTTPRYYQPTSPKAHSHSHHPPMSPPMRNPGLASPGIRPAYSSSAVEQPQGSPRPQTSSALEPAAAATTPKMSVASTLNSPSGKPTPSRAAGVMSFSNILSEPAPEAGQAPAPKLEQNGHADPLEALQAKSTTAEERVSPPRTSPAATEKPNRDVTPAARERSQSTGADRPASEKQAVESSDETIKSTNGVSAAEPAVEAVALPEEDDKKPRKARVSKPRRGSVPAAPKNESAPAPRKRQANGQPKTSAQKKRRVADPETDVSADDDDTTDAQEWHQRSKRRRLDAAEEERNRRNRRRADFIGWETALLDNQSEFGRRRYDEIYYEAALAEVRERDMFAEKERKKDMQRKRRREKSMAATIEQKEAAMAKAAATEDPMERSRLLREAERASKKAQQTKLILQKGIKGTPRASVVAELRAEAGLDSPIASDVDSPGPGKSKAASKAKGSRPKKSKEQKQAEKASAEAAQAALDAGEDLPAKEEKEPKIRLKVKKDAAKDKEPVEDQAPKPKEPPPEPVDKFQTKGYNQIYDQILRDIARKDVTKVYRFAGESYGTKTANLKKTAILAAKEAKRWQQRTNKGTKDLQARAKRVMRDMMGFWKRNEREERDLRKAAERQELENARKEEADREAARQKRKLNFLISQTELYSHFIGKKIKTAEVERSTDLPGVEPAPAEAAAPAPTIEEPTGPIGSKVTNFESLDFDNDDESTLRAAAMANAQTAIAEAQQKARDFNRPADADDMDEDGEMNFQNPTGMSGNVEIEQPKLLNCQLKEYQLKGLNWLANLYEQGINGILADEMGLGKTVQSISVMAYLAEKYDVWGPFLVVAPASTLHNWQQEIAKFVPDFKVLPYWGTAADRKVLRKLWDRKHSTYKRESAFHVCVTSYQLVVSDVAYFQKMRWQYMILDEAQAIKSSSSSRWKCLLGFHCRNRLLLTGTPIQNNMQELWALLHFIMPSLFDSHDEFSEWFSKDIESHAQSNTKLNEDQLKRLHMILKPFMLRRVKKHVQKELGDKIELDVFCKLTYRQRAYYTNLRNQINIMDLIDKATVGDDTDSGTLMNLVMQFRKVCNHPDLFQRADTASPFAWGYFAETASFVREGNNVPVAYSVRNSIEYELPRLIWRDGGRLDKPSWDGPAGFKRKYLGHMFNIWAPDNMRESEDVGAFSWLRFADTSAQEAYDASRRGLFARSQSLAEQRRDRLARLKVVYDDEDGKENDVLPHALFNIQSRTNRQPLAEVATEGIMSHLMNVAQPAYVDSGLGKLEQAGRPRASAPPIEVVCDSSGTAIEREDTMFNVGIRRALYGPNPVEEKAFVTERYALERLVPPPLLPEPDNEARRFTRITTPSMRRFVTDSGKLAKLDELLFKLKEENHRVLLYFQMTRMIDLMEEYLTYRNYKYCRLDGSTKLEDRRDTVHDFQTRPEIFIFLLSTRAGGLGINLTSADTVIFYDSDWNPTIDSQAMDRAHRLGQTRQVTVYRLITKGTIEERIRKRALQKEEVQRVVITGGGASVDFSGRRAPENRNKDIAMWLADDEQAEMIERRERELLESGELEKLKKKGGKRKRTGGAAADAGLSLDEMYHEGEGNFDGAKAIPGEGDEGAGDAGSRPAKKRKGTSKKAKTTKQRLAIADGEA